VLSQIGSGAGDDDPEFVVYGDSIQNGRPQVLKNKSLTIVAGHKACGVGGIQPA